MSVLFNVKRIEKKCCKTSIKNRLPHDLGILSDFHERSAVIVCRECSYKIAVRNIRRSKKDDLDFIVRFEQADYSEFKVEDLFTIKDFIS